MQIARLHLIGLDDLQYISLSIVALSNILCLLPNCRNLSIRSCIWTNELTGARFPLVVTPRYWNTVELAHVQALRTCLLDDLSMVTIAIDHLSCRDIDLDETVYIDPETTPALVHTLKKLVVRRYTTDLLFNPWSTTDATPHATIPAPSCVHSLTINNLRPECASAAQAHFNLYKSSLTTLDVRCTGRQMITGNVSCYGGTYTSVDQALPQDDNYHSLTLIYVSVNIYTH